MSEKRAKTKQALRESEESERHFRKRLASLLMIINEVSRADSLDELCRQAVERGRQELGFDRLSIMLLEEEGLHTLSTFGTDESGKTRDERGIRLPVTGNLKQLLEEGGPVRIRREQDYPLRNDREEIVGQGNHVVVGLWDGEHVIGYVNSDNLISRKATTDQQCELLSLYAASLGHLVSRLRATEALRESEQRFRSLVETTSEWIWAIDLKGVHTYSNPAIKDILGYEPEDLVGRSSLVFMHEQDRERVQSMLPRCIQDKTGWRNLLIRWRHKDGSYRYLESNAVPIFDHRGELCGYQGVDRDITDRKRAEQELRGNERFLGNILDAIQDGISVLDLEMNVVRVNETMRRWYAHAQPLEGKKCYEVYHGRSQACEICPTLRALNTGKLEVDCVPLTQADGTAGMLELFAFPILDDSGQLTGVVEYVRDITAQMQAEEQLKRYREHLEELIEQRTLELQDSQEQLRRSERLASIGTLAAGIAHEINNPVGQVLLAAQAAHAAGTDPKRLEKPLADIVNYANRCKNIVQNIQRFARKETSHKIPCDLNHITRQAGELMQEYARKRNCKIGYELAENLPKISLNKIGIEQVLVNLIKNAIEARARSVAIQTRCNNKEICLIVEDNGEGIPDQVKKRLFDPFYTTRQSRGGTGLGLSLVHGIIREHGGNIDVRGEPGQGTTFTITLPKTADETEEAT